MCRFRYYNPRTSWVLKLALITDKRRSTLNYNPRTSWVLKLCGTQSAAAYMQDYNPRTSWVLKLIWCIITVVIIEHYNPRASWVLKQYDHRYMLAINIEMKKLYFKMAIKKRH